MGYHVEKEDNGMVRTLHQVSEHEWEITLKAGSIEHSSAEPTQAAAMAKLDEYYDLVHPR